MFVNRTGKFVLAAVFVAVAVLCCAGYGVSGEVFPKIDASAVAMFWGAAGFCVLSPVFAYVAMGVTAGEWKAPEEPEDKGLAGDVGGEV